MTAPVTRLTAPLSRPRRAAAWTLLLTVGACLLAAGCSSGDSSANGSSMNGTAEGGGAVAAAPLPAHAPGVSAGKASGSSGSGASAGLTSVPVPGGQSVIFTATLSLRATNIQATAAKATQLAEAAG